MGETVGCSPVFGDTGGGTNLAATAELVSAAAPAIITGSGASSRAVSSVRIGFMALVIAGMLQNKLHDGLGVAQAVRMMPHAGFGDDFDIAAEFFVTLFDQ